MGNNKKIEVVYPNGERDCQSVVSNTYRKAITYLGLEKVRSLQIERNSINIISTGAELENTRGKRENRAISGLERETDLGICTQFATEQKYRILVEANEKLQGGLRIGLIEPSHEKSVLTLADNEISDEIKEGILKEYTMTRYERNPEARRQCLKHYGRNVVCQICGFDFEKIYGTRENAEPYIEIHHINPLADKSRETGEHEVDCINDLIPVCANCHRMLHHLKKETLHPSELKKIIEQRAHRN